MRNLNLNKDENPELPGSDWDYTFSEHPDSHRDRPDGYRVTKVSITIYNESLARMEKMIEMGFTEGFNVSMNNLESLLASRPDGYRELSGLSPK